MSADESIPPPRPRMSSAPDIQLLDVMPSNKTPGELYRAARTAGAWLVTLSGQTHEVVGLVRTQQRQFEQNAKDVQLQQLAQDDKISRALSDSDAQKLKWAILQWLVGAALTVILTVVLTGWLSK